MTVAIRPQRLNHMNAVLRDFDASTAHFREHYGAEFVVDIPQNEFHACLIAIGSVGISPDRLANAPAGQCSLQRHGKA